MDRNVIIRLTAASALAVLLLAAAEAAHAQDLSLWGGGGLGSFLAGGAKEPNAHRLLVVGFTFPGDAFELRALKGTFERSRELPSKVGDDDLDYRGVDAVVKRAATGLPVDVAVGVVRYEETYHVGYPHFDLGGQVFIHRYGPHLSALRAWPATRFGQLWVEADLHYAPYQPRQVVVFLDVGVGLHAQL
jgi:hypothetical protein